MKFTKQDLLTLLIGLFLFASCKDSNTIGLDLDPDYAIKGTLMDSATVTSQTLKDEVASGVGLVRHPLGVMVDPVFGKSEAAVAVEQLGLYDRFNSGPCGRWADLCFLWCNCHLCRYHCLHPCCTLLHFPFKTNPG